MGQWATDRQAERLGVTLPSADVPSLASPSDAVLELYERLDRRPAAEQAERIEALDELPAGPSAALTDTIAAFLAVETAASQAYADGSASPAELAEVLAARSALIEAVPALEISFDAPTVDPADIRQAPVLALDLNCELDGSDSDHYKNDYVLIVDLCGDDVYENNAGGTIDFDISSPSNIQPDPGCRDTHPGELAAASVSAAVIDLDGTDNYGDPDFGDSESVAPRGCGINGGGILGAGFLWDGEGGDNYTAGRVAGNGGGHFGVGYLHDAGNHPDDDFVAAGQGVNGGGFVSGVGTLVDSGGGATYEITTTNSTRAEQATNGGGFLAGIGLLADGSSGSATFIGDGPEWNGEISPSGINGCTSSSDVCVDAPNNPSFGPPPTVSDDDDGLGLRLDL